MNTIANVMDIKNAKVHSLYMSGAMTHCGKQKTVNEFINVDERVTCEKCLKALKNEIWESYSPYSHNAK
jgi:predicted nucleic acid-binding Zn ribbon protein